MKKYTEEIQLSVIERVKSGESVTKISNELNIGRSAIYLWLRINKISVSPIYNKPVPIKYDFKLFETLIDVEFAIKYNISQERARQLRAIHASHTNTNEISKIRRSEKEKEIDKKILEFIIQHKTNIKVSAFTENIAYVQNPKERFLRIAKENNIEIKFFDQKEKVPYHGTSCLRIKCRCQIYKFADALYRYSLRNKLKIEAIFIDYFANKHIELYINKTFKKVTGNETFLKEFENVKQIDKQNILEYLNQIKSSEESSGKSSGKSSEESSGKSSEDDYFDFDNSIF